MAVQCGFRGVLRGTRTHDLQGVPETVRDEGCPLLSLFRLVLAAWGGAAV